MRTLGYILAGLAILLFLVPFIVRVYSRQVFQVYFEEARRFKEMLTTDRSARATPKGETSSIQ